METAKKKVSASIIVRQGICYLLGLFLIAFGINFSKMSNLGISPVSSIPRVLEVIWGFTLGTMLTVVYIVLVIAQIIVLGKKFQIKNILGILLAFVFGWITDLTGIDPKAFGHWLLNFPRPQTYIVKLLYLAIAIILIGIGVLLYLRPNWIPMPAEGLAAAISGRTGKAFGDCKTYVDSGMILVALILQLIFLGGFKSFTGDNVVIREGTILCAILIGQVVKFLAKRFGSKIDRLIGKGQPEIAKKPETEKEES